MPVVPSGDPAWVRTSDYATYGGHRDKANYQGQPKVNARTDVGAEELARLADDLAAAVRTAPFCVLTLICNDSAATAPAVSFPAAPSIESVNQMTGIRQTAYLSDAAPTGFPSGVRNGNGDVSLTWATSYTDAYGVAGDVEIKHVTATGAGVAGVFVTYEIVSAGVVRFRAWNAAGTAVSNARISVKVWT